MDIQLRPGRPADAEICGDICYRGFKAIADQHNFPPDFPSVEVAVGMMHMLLQHPAVYSVVAEHAGGIIGSNFLWKSRPIACIGPITVDPAVQNASTGRRMMQDVLDHAARESFAGVRLAQSAWHNRSLSLYLKLGFDVREHLAAVSGPVLQRAIAGYAVRPATEADVAACNRLCIARHGHDRGAELGSAIAHGTATVVEHAGHISGYATDIGFLGHAVGESNADLQALIAAAPAFNGPGFIVPLRNGELMRWCFAGGLRIVQTLNLMSIGLYNEPDGPFMPSILY